jgi:hypothetical protein
MKTNFYTRTAYKLSDQPVPNCFLKLDDQFDKHFSTFEEAFLNPCLVLAESLCARMADLEMYEKAAILTRSFFFGYLGAGRALLDTSAVTLAALHALPMTTVDCSFSNGDFWHQLVTAAPNVHRRYHPLRLFITEFLRYCNEAPHRVPPLVVLQNHFGKFAPRDTRLQVTDDPKANLSQMATESVNVRWVDPLHLHDRWKSQFLTLCEKICVDLEKEIAG